MAFKIGNEKFWKWRALGFIGFSFLAHAGLVTALIAQPQSTANDVVGVASGSGGDTAMVEVGDAGSSQDLLSGEAEQPMAKAEASEVEAPKVAAPPEPVALPKKQKPVAAAKKVAPAKAEAASDQSFIPMKEEAAAETVSATTTETPEDLSPEIAEEAPVETPQIETSQKDPVPTETQPSETQAATEAATTETNEVSEPTPTATESVVSESKAESNSESNAETKAETNSESTEPAQNSESSPAEQTGGPVKGGQAESASEPGQGLGAAGEASGGKAGLYGVPQGTKIREAGLRKPLTGNKNPHYPETERLSRTEGTAILVGQIKEDGSISQVFVERSSGSKSLDQAAVKAFSRWKYEAGSEEYLRQPFEFKLSGDPQVYKRRIGQNP